MRKKVLYFSLAVNMLLVGAALFFGIKRWRFQHAVREKVPWHSYFDNPAYAAELSLEKAYTGHADVVMLGDSYVYMARWNELLQRCDVAVRGIPGDVTAGYLNRLDAVVGVHPKICFLEGGTNDIRLQVSQDTTFRNLMALMDELQYEKIGIVFHTVPPMAKGNPEADGFNKKAITLNARIRDLCQKTGYPFIDLYALFQQDGYLNTSYAQADGIHLTGEAYKLWAGEINKKLQGMGGQLAGQ
jgi:lysophospholipase L1-like esterase